jgi:lipopolysaccharide export system protein LptC
MLFRLFTVLAVIALAVSTWILSSPSHRPRPPSATGAADLPGYYLKNAVLTDYDATGTPTIRIEAERIDQVAHSPEVLLSNVRVNYLAPGGQNWLMFGDRAHVQSGGNIVDVEGNVRLQGEGTSKTPAAVIRTDTLSYDVAESVATTKSDVRIDFGAHTLTAHGLVANLRDRTMHLESKVNGRFQP